MSSVAVYGVGSLPTLLTLLFVGLKFTGHIAWSWWWVLSPLLLTWGFGILIAMMVVLGTFIYYFTAEVR